jgi:hypothetical protein
MPKDEISFVRQPGNTFFIQFASRRRKLSMGTPCTLKLAFRWEVKQSIATVKRPSSLANESHTAQAVAARQTAWLIWNAIPDSFAAMAPPRQS